MRTKVRKIVNLADIMQQPNAKMGSPWSWKFQHRADSRAATIVVFVCPMHVEAPLVIDRKTSQHRSDRHHALIWNFHSHFRSEKIENYLCESLLSIGPGQIPTETYLCCQRERNLFVVMATD